MSGRTVIRKEVEEKRENRLRYTEKAKMFVNAALPLRLKNRVLFSFIAGCTSMTANDEKRKQTR